METAIAVVACTVVAIIFYRAEQRKNREEAAIRAANAYDGMRDERIALTNMIGQLVFRNGLMAEETKAVHESLGPLVESLAESLQAQMSTIDREMADLRTRVETGPGKRTLRV